MQVIGTLASGRCETDMQGLVMVASHSLTEPWQRPPDDPAGDMSEMTFTADQLPAVRRFTAAHARRRRIDDDVIGDLVIAVNEIATNAVRHGSPTAGLRIWSDRDRLIAEIHDTGTWAPATEPGTVPPPAGAEGGMGLWVARQICSVVRVSTGITGTVVRLELSVPARYI